MFWRCTTNSKTRPNESFRIKNSDVIKIALLESGSLLLASSFYHVIIVKPKTTMNNEICTYQNCAMAFSWGRSRTCCVRFRPCHYFEIKSEDIIKELFTVPSTEYNHFSATYEVCSVVESCGRSTSTPALQLPCAPEEHPPPPGP